MNAWGMQEAIDRVACRTCLADKGQPCIVQNGLWSQTREYPHAKRTSDYYKSKHFAEAYGADQETLNSQYASLSEHYVQGPDDLVSCNHPPETQGSFYAREGEEKAVSKKEMLERSLERIMSEIDKLEVLGEDVYEDETVLLLKLKHSNSGTVYSYVALKVEGRWYITGYQNQGPRSWSQLVEFFTRGELVEMWMNTGWEQVL